MASRHGPESDIVISSRIRLRGTWRTFVHQPRTPQDRTQTERSMRDCILALNTSGDLLYVAVTSWRG